MINIIQASNTNSNCVVVHDVICHRCVATTEHMIFGIVITALQILCAEIF